MGIDRFMRLGFAAALIGGGIACDVNFPNVAFGYVPMMTIAAVLIGLAIQMPTWPAEPKRKATFGAGLIVMERVRQIYKHGHDPAGDETNRMGELAISAVAYIAGYLDRESSRSFLLADPDEIAEAGCCEYKPSDDIRDLTKAGALIAAEIDRLHRRRNVVISYPHDDV